MEIIDDGFVEVARIALVEGVDLAPWGDLDVRVGKHELAERGIEREAVDAVARCQDQVGGGSVPAVCACEGRRTRLART